MEKNAIILIYVKQINSVLLFFLIHYYNILYGHYLRSYIVAKKFYGRVKFVEMRLYYYIIRLLDIIF